MQKDSERSFYCYVIFFPNGTPGYVGKGKGGRWLSRRREHNGQLLELLRAHTTLPVVKVREDCTSREALETEIALIAALGRADLCQGPLLNLTDGGDSPYGYRHSEERKEKIRLALAGKPKSEEHRAALSESRKGQIPSEEHRAALREGHKRQWADPKKRAAMSDKLLIIPLT
jgi:NUMOD3 motif-containing protein